MVELRAKNQHYEAWLQWYINYQCNFNCTYCFQSLDRNQRLFKKISGFFYPHLLRKFKKVSGMGLSAWLRNINDRLFKTQRTAPINIPALIKSLDKTNKTFRIGFAGGEPFLVPNIIEACVEITKKHFVSLNTNLVTRKAEEFAEKISPARTLFVVASLHINELERSRLLDRYLRTFLRYQQNGFNIISESVAYPPLLEKAVKYKILFQEKGIAINFSPFLGYYNGKHYPESYRDEELRVFGLDNTCRVQFNLRGKICNAGYNVALVSSTGAIHICHQIQEGIGNIYREIKFKNKLVTCPFDFCSCPLKIYDPYLFEKACSETGQDYVLSGSGK
jgi:organic radical activating enzyme